MNAQSFSICFLGVKAKKMYRANRKAISKQVRVGADKHSSIPDDRNQVHEPETVTTQTESCLLAMFPYNDQQMDEVTDSSSDDEFNSLVCHRLLEAGCPELCVMSLTEDKKGNKIWLFRCQSHV